MSDPSNGSHVTWRELSLVREAWKRELELVVEPLAEGIERLEVKLQSRTAFWSNAWVLIVASAIGAAVGTSVWFLFG